MCIRDRAPAEREASSKAPQALPAKPPERWSASVGPSELEAPIVQEAKPLYRRNPSPKYPRLARRRGYEGTVVLEVLVDRSGRVKDLRVADPSRYPVLDKAARASVESWLFEPGRRRDVPVDMWVRVPIRFQLK